MEHYTDLRYYNAETMSYGHEKKFRHIELKKATEDEVREHYKHYSELKEEFENTRPSFYMTHGTFNSDPLISHYKYFLLDKGIKYIAIKEK